MWWKHQYEQIYTRLNIPQHSSAVSVLPASEFSLSFLFRRALFLNGASHTYTNIALLYFVQANILLTDKFDYTFYT